MPQFDLKEIQNIRNNSLTDAIFRQLEKMILSHEIKPGERINESGLAAMLGVSRAPIREALRQLESQGILEIKTNKGMFVRSVQLDEAGMLYDIRAALDALAGEKAAEVIRESDFEVLEQWIDKMAESVEAGDSESYYRDNLNFHLAIVEIAGNKYLSEIYGGICNQMSLCRRVTLSLPGALSVSLQRHREIVAALRSGNGKKAAKVLQNHTLAAKKSLVKAISRKPRASEEKQPAGRNKTRS
jgi:DNA-binding GntR family transcriptional regulator